MNDKITQINKELDMLAQELSHNVRKWHLGELKHGINNVLAIAQEIKKLEDEETALYESDEIEVESLK